MSLQLAIVLPTLNERGNLRPLVERLEKALDGILFIDRLGPAQLTALRDELEEFELVFQSRRDTGEIATPEQLAARILELEKLRT